MTFQQARRLLLSFPGVEEGSCYGTPGFRVRGKFLARLKEDGTTLVVKCGDAERDFSAVRQNHRGKPRVPRSR